MKVFLVGVGGATCSGKTTLAKHLRRIIPNSFIVHQDDFAPPQELVPYHPEFKVQDWDDAPGAIEWPRMRSALAHVKKTGKLPDAHYSHDHLNEQSPVPIADDLASSWHDRLSELVKQYPDEDVFVAILDGFLLYWDKEVFDQMDVRVFLRVPHDTLKQRRHERHGYHTAVQSDPEGSLWRDPPQYWEQIVYPAYVRAHQDLFENEDIENGTLKLDLKEALVLLESDKSDMSEIVDRTCQAIAEKLQLSEA